jgi:hypothetical protein
MSETAEKQSRAWIWCLVAIGLLPLSFLVGKLGLDGAFAPGPEAMLGPPFWLAILLLSPAVALTGLIWIVVLIRRSNPGTERSKPQSNEVR